MRTGILAVLLFLTSLGVGAQDAGCAKASKEISAFFAEQALPGADGQIQSYRAKVLLDCAQSKQVCVYGDPVEVDAANGGEAGTLWATSTWPIQKHLKPAKEVTLDHPMAYAGLVDLGIHDGGRICVLGAAPTGQDNLWLMVVLKVGASSVTQIAWHPFHQGDFLDPDQFVLEIVSSSDRDFRKRSGR